MTAFALECQHHAHAPERRFKPSLYANCPIRPTLPWHGHILHFFAYYVYSANSLISRFTNLKRKCIKITTLKAYYL